MQYPKELLSRTANKFIDCDLSEFYLLRSTLAKELLDNNGLLKDEHIASPRSQLFDYSTNLLSIYNESHVPISLIGEEKSYFVEYCDLKNDCKHPVYEKDFCLEHQKGYWVILIRSVIESAFTCDYKGSDLIFESKVLHTPTRSNFWHFSIRWSVSEASDVKLEGASKNQARKIENTMYSEARSAIKQLAITTEVKYMELEEKKYKKN